MLGRDGRVDVATSLMVACAVLVTFVVVRREFAVKPVGPPISARSASTLPGELWSTVRSGRALAGDPSAAAELVVFSDFQCPFCRDFALRTLRGVQESQGDSVTVAFRHLPIPGHAGALPAAIAAECAGRQGRFREMHDSIFVHQERMNGIDYRQLASQAGVRDGDAFGSCLDDPSVMERIAEDVTLARRVGIQGTPGVIVNGVYYTPPPDSAELIDILATGNRERATSVGLK